MLAAARAAPGEPSASEPAPTGGPEASCWALLLSPCGSCELQASSPARVGGGAVAAGVGAGLSSARSAASKLRSSLAGIAAGDAGSAATGDRPATTAAPSPALGAPGAEGNMSALFPCWGVAAVAAAAPAAVPWAVTSSAAELLRLCSDLASVLLPKTGPAALLLPSGA